MELEGERLHGGELPLRLAPGERRVLTIDPRWSLPARLIAPTPPVYSAFVATAADAQESASPAVLTVQRRTSVDWVTARTKTIPTAAHSSRWRPPAPWPRCVPLTFSPAKSENGMRCHTRELDVGPRRVTGDFYFSVSFFGTK